MTTQVAMRIPFELGQDGGIAVETAPDRQVSQRVRALVGTEPGGRVMNVRLGLDLAHLLFEPGDDRIEGELIHDVAELMAAYEPGIRVLSVRPIVGTLGDGLVDIEVDYTRIASTVGPGRLAESVNTAVITIGGSVSEVVRG